MRIRATWALPAAFTAKDVHKKLGRDWVCPWCRSERVSARDTQWLAASRWIELEARTQEPKWICEGCAVEVCNACNSTRFDDHIDRSLVEGVAKEEGMSVVEFRRKCLGDQVALIRRENLHLQGSEESRMAYSELLEKLERLLGTLS